MPIYINGMGCISPQPTFDNSVFLPEVKEFSTNRIVCVDPDYNAFFDAGSIRRMWHLLKFGTAAGLIALKDAGLKTPGAITTGTGLGLPEVSQKFLRSLIESDETIVSPTTFIQSTHNTVSSNIALLCGCHAHNNTFSQRGFSFESALTDALLLSEENTDNILVGAFDEVSNYKFTAMKKRGVLRSEPCSNLDAFAEHNHGVIAGEGAAFFVLSKQKNENTYSSFVGCKMFYKPENTEEVKNYISSFLAENHLSVADVDIILEGVNGDENHDAVYKELNRSFFGEQTQCTYKNLCGEYMTASSFAYWLAAKILKTQIIPPQIIHSDKKRAPKYILIYNSYANNHSLILFRHV